VTIFSIAFSPSSIKLILKCDFFGTGLLTVQPALRISRPWIKARRFINRFMRIPREGGKGVKMKRKKREKKGGGMNRRLKGSITLWVH
jgi:hypothetical protein